jgi:RimJ/RimL family protein N-acetyltransferase
MRIGGIADVSDNPSTTPVVNITGHLTALGPFDERLAEALHRWYNDFAVTVLDGGVPHPQTMEVSRGEVARFSTDDKTRYAFAIYERTTMRLIGFVDLRNINYRQRTAESGIMIGEQDCWGKGYGTETLYLVLDYAFSVLGLHNIMLSMAGYNERALRTYRRVGFREIGRRREICSIGNTFTDAVFMDCLSTEFHSPLAPIVTLPSQAEIS